MMHSCLWRLSVLYLVFDCLWDLTKHQYEMGDAATVTGTQL